MGLLEFEQQFGFQGVLMAVFSPIKHETVVAAERLEAEICELAGHLAAATCRYLLLLAEFDRRDGWAGWGIRSCAQWLSWKCGLSPATAREQVRVARALDGLPVVTQAFSAGRLSYSKVRALTRVATLDSEAELVETALVSTAAQLERIVAGLRKATRDEVVERHARRKVGWHHDEDGSFVMTVRLDPEEGAVALAALRAAQARGCDGGSAAARDAQSVSAETPSAGECGGDSAPAGDAQSVSAETPPAGKCNDGSAAARDAQSVSAETPSAGECGGDSAPAGDAQSVSAETPPAGKCNDGSAPATDVQNVSAETPSAGTAEPLALPDALTAIFGAYLAGKAGDASDPEPFQVVVHVDADTLAAASPGDSPAASGRDLTPCEDTGRPGGHLDDGPALYPDTVRRLACDATTVRLIHRADGSVLDAGRRTRRIGVRLRRALRVRDEGRCRFPGCQRRLDLHAHHVVHWSQGGPTNLDNLASLCTAHHWLVHDGGYRMWLTPGGDLRFATPAGVPIPAVPVPAPVTGDIRDRHQATITPGTIIPGWDGAPLDLDNAVLALLQPAAVSSAP
jgi:hypothetical protein